MDDFSFRVIVGLRFCFNKLDDQLTTWYGFLFCFVSTSSCLTQTISHGRENILCENKPLWSSVPSTSPHSSVQSVALVDLNETNRIFKSLSTYTNTRYRGLNNCLVLREPSGRFSDSHEFKLSLSSSNVPVWNSDSTASVLNTNGVQWNTALIHLESDSTTFNPDYKVIQL
ncbi:hypothetical protein EG68_12190 [Paragonimus skrjabini miyazakii]|uniref:Uncharacterized protein n=1 Tax=Paragonimus skrjabini miyazakii TaxID=59628 RepID=A0A8S9YA37_9TREM|nr:hypothetical protein EG68_12190 [Paragonimus skrjabini miyazakii]